MEKKQDGREIAEIIGVSSTLTWKDEDNFFMIKVCKNGKWINRKVYELSEDEAKKLKSHSLASGMNFGHCLYLVNKYWKDFKKQVCGYRIVPSDRKECSVSVAFYAKD